VKTTQWYTYKLCYPNGTPFYFGKGTSDREYQHKSHAKKDLILRDRVINDILHRGLDITVKIIEYYDNENEAFRVERANIELFSVTELLTNVIYNPVPHNWKKHQRQLNILLKEFQTTTQAWPDEVYRLGATTQRWEDDETIDISKYYETQIKQNILNDVVVNKKGIEEAEKKSRMIAEYEKMISERKPSENTLPQTNMDESEEQDETYKEEGILEAYSSEKSFFLRGGERQFMGDSDETYVEETECGYCGVVFSNVRNLEEHYESCSEKPKYVKTTNIRKKRPK
jgi:hypothetical protein